MWRECNPAHANVVSVLGREVEDAGACRLFAGKWFSQRDARGHDEHNGGLAMTSWCRERVEEPPLQLSENYVFGRCEVLDELRAGLDPDGERLSVNGVLKFFFLIGILSAVLVPSGPDRPTDVLEAFLPPFVARDGGCFHERPDQPLRGAVVHATRDDSGREVADGIVQRGATENVINQGRPVGGIIVTEVVTVGAVPVLLLGACL